MKQEDKELLLKDLCARLPYSPFVQLMEKFDDEDTEHFMEIHQLSTYDIELFNSGEISNIKPYLRPMSSMTEEEKVEYGDRCYFALNCIYENQQYYFNELFDWLNKKMFDFRGLIEKGLALSTEVFNPYK